MRSDQMAVVVIILQFNAWRQLISELLSKEWLFIACRLSCFVCKMSFAEIL